MDDSDENCRGTFNLAHDLHDQQPDFGGSRLWRNLVGLVKRVSASPFLAGLVSSKDDGSSSPSNNLRNNLQNDSNLSGQWQEEISILIDSLSLINNIFYALTSGFSDSQATDSTTRHHDTGQDNNHNKSTGDLDEDEQEQQVILQRNSELFYDALEVLNTQQLLAYFEDVEPEVSEQLRILEQQSNKFLQLNNSSDKLTIFKQGTQTDHDTYEEQGTLATSDSNTSATSNSCDTDNSTSGRSGDNRSICTSDCDNQNSSVDSNEDTSSGGSKSVDKRTNNSSDETTSDGDDDDQIVNIVNNNDGNMVLAANSNRVSPLSSTESQLVKPLPANFNANGSVGGGDHINQQQIITSTPPSRISLNYQNDYNSPSTTSTTKLPSTISGALNYSHHHATTPSSNKHQQHLRQQSPQTTVANTNSNNNKYKDCEPTTYDDQDYESANDTSFCDNMTTPANNNDLSPRDNNNIKDLSGTESSKSPSTNHNQQRQDQTKVPSGNKIASSIQSTEPSSSTTSSTTSISSLAMANANHDRGGDDAKTTSNSDGVATLSHKTRRPNFIIINKSGRTANDAKHDDSQNVGDNNVRSAQLARGNKQRASTSSCSSSDSYGSGYASGSGNSTDHEHKEKLKRELLSSLQGAAAANSSIDQDEGDEGDEEIEDDDEEVTPRETDDNSKSHDADPTSLAINSGFGKTSESRSTTITPTATNKSNTAPIAGNEDLSSIGSPYKPTHKSHNRRTSSSSTSMEGQIIDENLELQTSQKTFSPTKSNIIISNNVISQKMSPPRKNNGNTSINVAAPQNDHQQQQAVSSLDKQEPYYHTLFQWEQLVSKGVTRPLLINDLDFTDLRDEDDCDLLNASQQQQHNNINSHTWSAARIQTTTGEPLHIKIPNSQTRGEGQDQIDSGTSSGPNSGSPRAAGSKQQTPVSAPPPMPPPPMSPWFNTFSVSRPQSQLLLSPTPSFDTVVSQGCAALSDGFNREESPVDSTCSNYSRDSFGLPHTSTPTHNDNGAINSRNNQQQQHHQFNTLQPISSLRSASSMSSLLFGSNGKYGSKRKKTMKLFWKEVREDRSLLSKLTRKKTIWDEIKPVPIDTQKLEYLFESKAKDLSLSRSRNGLDGLNQRKAKITVLDTKRSNAINIGMTKLPPMRTIKSAILKMDSDIMNREGIEKILTTMMPTEEEKSRIIEAQLANPETPLGTAEQFLLNLASISALEARLKLWAFQLDYAQIEKEVAEPLMDLKQAIEEIEQSETFRLVLGTLLSIGNFLNSSNVKGFQIDYLEKVPEVKDTVHKHSLLHHLCVFMQERYEHTTSDLYSEFSAVNRASKIDYIEVGKSLKKMQQDCKASWDYLKIVAKHDGLANLMNTSNNANINLSSSSNSSSSASNNTSQSLSSPNGLSNPSLSPLGNSNSKLQPQCGKLNNLSKLSMITTITSSDTTGPCSSNNKQEQPQQQHQQQANLENNSSNTTNIQSSSGKQMKTKVNDFLTDCAERIMVLMVIHRRVMNRFQKLLVYLGCPSHQIKQTQPQQVLKVINEFALEYRTKRERVREMIAKRQQCQQHNNQGYQNNHHHYLQNSSGSRWQLQRNRWAGSQQYLDGNQQTLHRPCSTAFSSYSGSRNQLAIDPTCPSLSCCDNMLPRSHNNINGPNANNGLLHAGAGGGVKSGGRYADSPYSDYLYDDQASNYCQSRQQSVTPVPADSRRRCQGMSVSLFDLQNQQHQQLSDNASKTAHNLDHQHENNKNGGGYNDHNDINHRDNDPERIAQRQKDEQLCRLLGVGKSFDGACSDLLKMSHWTTTSQRVLRHQPSSVNLQRRRQRAVSIDCSSQDDRSFNDQQHQNQFTSSSTAAAGAPADMRRQSWQNSKYGPHNSFNGNYNSCMDDELAQNSDEEIMHCLVRHANTSGRNSLGGSGGGGATNGFAAGRLSANSYYGLQPQRGKLVARDSNT